jgi:hypothetical protein
MRVLKGILFYTMFSLRPLVLLTCRFFAVVFIGTYLFAWFRTPAAGEELPRWLISWVIGPLGIALVVFSFAYDHWLLKLCPEDKMVVLQR